MKKHDEGYVLAYVMVILAVLMLIAMSVMSVSLTNLQRQRDEVERMRDKYVAEGAIEQAIAMINESDGFVLLEKIQLPGEFADAIRAEVVSSTIQNDSLKSKYSCNIMITARKNASVVTCEVIVESAAPIVESEEHNFGLQAPKILGFASYKISTVEPDADPTEGGPDQ